MRATLRRLFIASSFLAAISIASGQPARLELPEGYIVVPSSISRDGRFGVTAFDDSIYSLPPSGKIENRLVDLRAGHLGAPIVGGEGTIRMNRGGIQPARWSTDDSLLLWEVEGRWSPANLTLIHLQDSQILSQLDVLRVAQAAILKRTRQAAPQRYQAAEKFNKGNGAAFPDGFTVNVRAEGDKPRGEPKQDVHGLPIALPFKVHVELTSNPKRIDGIGEAQLDSALDAVVTSGLKFQVTGFHLRDKPFDSALSPSWLEMTDPQVAAMAPRNYGDAVELKGHLSTRPDRVGHPVVVLTLQHPISILASRDDPAAPAVSEVQLDLAELGAESWQDAEKRTECEAYGTLIRSRESESRLPIGLIVSGLGY